MRDGPPPAARRGNSIMQNPIPLQFTDSYAQFNELHINQDGVIR